MLHKLRHWFIPHETNNHKARALHPQAFLFYMMLIFVLQVSLKTIHTNFPGILGFATDISITRLMELTNQKRASAGLPPLAFSGSLSAAAANKAADMFSKNYWAHVAPDGKTPWDFITGAGYHYIYAGENLAKNFNDSNSVVDAWMASPTHRDNVLKKEYKEIGFAVVNGKLNGEDTTLVVEMFGSPTLQPLAQVNQNVPVILPTQIPVPTTSQLAAVLTPTMPVAAITEVPVIASTSKIPLNQELKVASARSIPLINVTILTKILSLTLIGFLMIILGVDSIFIWKRKTYRVAGHNFAHMLFLITLVGIVYLTGSGVIM